MTDCDNDGDIYKLAEHHHRSDLNPTRAEPCDNTKTSGEGCFQDGVGLSTFSDYGLWCKCHSGFQSF